MDNFNVHKFLRESYLDENKGVEAADKIIAYLREKVFPKLNDDDLYTFKERIADAFDMELKEEDEKPPKETIPAYKIVLSYVEGNGRFYGMYIYENQDSKNWDHKLDYSKSKVFLEKYNIKPELPQIQDFDSEKDIDAILEQLRNREVIAHSIEMDVS